MLLLLPLAYLLGSVPDREPRRAARPVTTSSREGSGNPGASNVYRLAGWKAGLIVLVGDIGKGRSRRRWVSPSTATGARTCSASPPSSGTCSRSCQRFRGGRGVATAGGTLIVIFPLITLGLAIALVPHRPGAAQGVGGVDRRDGARSRSRWR